MFLSPLILFERFLIQDGCGTISVNKEVYPVRKGILCFWGPDIVHEISSDPTQPLTILGVLFHMTCILQPVQFLDFNGYPHVQVIQAQAQIEALLLEIVKEYTGQRLYWEASTGALFSIAFIPCPSDELVHRGGRRSMENDRANPQVYRRALYGTLNERGHCETVSLPSHLCQQARLEVYWPLTPSIFAKY